MSCSAELSHIVAPLTAFFQAIHCYFEDLSPPGTQTRFDAPMEKLQAIIPSNVAVKILAKAQREGAYGCPNYGVQMFNEAGENIADKVVSGGLAKKRTPSTGTAGPKQDADENRYVC